MAQRDEGLDKLEAFIAAAAETRANLQRNGERLGDLAQRLEEHFGDVEARLTELDDAIETFDARYGDQVQIILAVAVGVCIGVGALGLGPVGILVGIMAGILVYAFLGDQRFLLVNGCDAAILTYRALSEASARLRPVLAEAAEDAEGEFDAFCAAVSRALARPGDILEQALHA